MSAGGKQRSPGGAFGKVCRLVVEEEEAGAISQSVEPPKTGRPSKPDGGDPHRRPRAKKSEELGL
jgi:hypothetical protein